MARTAVETRIYSTLLAASAVTALVVDRIYPIVAKQACALPTLVFKRISTERVTSLSGETGLEDVRVQIDCRATTYLGAKALAHTVLDAMGAATSFSSLPDGQVDGYESDPEVFIVSLDFQVLNEEV